MRKTLDVAIAILQQGGQVLICRRKEGDSFAGYWEFPGGKRNDGETIEQCLHREIREELAIDIQITRAISPIDHEYPHVTIRLHPFLSQITSGQPQMIECQEMRWVASTELAQFRFPAANERFLPQIIQELR